jgi:hypothetical protein
MGGGVSDLRNRLETITAAIRRERDRCEARLRAYGEQCRQEGMAEMERRLRPEIDRLEQRFAKFERDMAIMREHCARAPTERIELPGAGNSG